jgi:hypothetical protein
MPKSKDKKISIFPQWRSFEEARKYARSLGLKTYEEWKEFVRGEIPDIPPRPNDVRRFIQDLLGNAMTIG